MFTYMFSVNFDIGMLRVNVDNQSSRYGAFLNQKY